MGLLDAKIEEDGSKNFRIAVYGVVIIGLLGVVIWWLLRFYPEKRVVTNFMDQLVAGQFEPAYKTWKASPSYAYKDFLDDWGPNGYYGPVKSFQVKGAAEPRRSTNSVTVTVAVSPYPVFPSGDDTAGQSKTKDVAIWVDRNDKSLSFPP